MNSRSAKYFHHVDSKQEIDGSKKIQGRKEHIIIDTLGFSLAIAIHEANLRDSKDSPQAIEKYSCKFPCLLKILTDGSY